MPEATDASHALDWLAFDASGQLLAQGISPLTDLPPAQRLELLLAPPQLSIHQLSLPRSPRHRLRPLILNVLEDRLLAPLDALHICFNQTRDGQTTVLISDRAWLCQWLDHFEQAGRHPAAAHALAEQVTDWRWISFQDGSQRGGVLQAPDGQIVQLDDQAVAQSLIPAEATLQSVTLADVLASLRESTSINVLQVEFAARSALQLDWKPLKRVGMLLAVLIGLLYLGEVAQWLQLRSATTALQRELRQTYAAAFPGEPIVDPALQIASKLRSSGLGGDSGHRFVDLLARIEPALGPGVQLSKLQFQSGTVQLTISSSDAADAAKRLGAAGFQVEHSGNALTLKEKTP
ncbi:type II secretion system protein GspL [Andreprevotia chitinilytica]|uniref:type II secretion system protein GspL n=1 Tax=Andreprevotia chitinilytica TaxID=396808 RepID=UPI0005528D3E|nr:type II secretion system protein GspL [Andreprevotia chitinilytica]